MRLILIAVHYPPDPAVGSQRARNVALAFAAAGYEVDVVTREHHSPVPVPADPGITVHSVVPWRSPRELYLGLKAALRPTRAAGDLPSSGEATAVQRNDDSLSGTLKRWAIAWLWLPDDQQGFIIPAARLARQLMTPGAVLYSTAPPFSPHLAARLALRGQTAPWVMELRDPWTDNHQKPKEMQSRLTRAIDRALEAQCLRRAQIIVSVSEGIARHLRPKLPKDEQGKVMVVYNGIERLRTDITPRAAPFRILHAGTCSYARDPRPFFKALAAVVRELHLGPEQVIADFVGDCRYHVGEAMEPLVLKLGLGSIVRFQDWVPREEALRLMSAADLHLLLAQEQPDQIPNKLYDYLGAGGRILAFADVGGETAALLEEAGGHFFVPGNDVGTAVAALRAVMQPASAVPPGANPRLQALTTDRQMAKLVERVGTLTPEGP